MPYVHVRHDETAVTEHGERAAAGRCRTATNVRMLEDTAVASKSEP